MKIVEAKGPSLALSREARRKAALHHIRLYGDPDSTPDAPKFLLEHHKSERDRNPEQHSFTGRELLVHLANTVGAPTPEEEN